MKIWHQKLIEYLPMRLLVRLHNDCCDLRALGWNEFRPELKYVFNGGRVRLSVYHTAVLKELSVRKQFDDQAIRRLIDWRLHNYRGPRLGFEQPDDKLFKTIWAECETRGTAYPEHDDARLLLDIDELHKLGVELPELKIETLARGYAS